MTSQKKQPLKAQMEMLGYLDILIYVVQCNVCLCGEVPNVYHKQF